MRAPGAETAVVQGDAAAQIATLQVDLNWNKKALADAQEEVQFHRARYLEVRCHTVTIPLAWYPCLSSTMYTWRRLRRLSLI